MKIALSKSSLFGPISGADETLVTYAAALRRAGHDVTVVLLYPPSRNDSYLRRLREAEVPVVAIAERSRLFAAVRGLRAAAAHFFFLFVLVSRFPGHVRRIWQSILRMLARLYLGRTTEFLRTNRFDILHVLTPDSGSAILIRAAHAAGVPTLYQELGTPYHMPELDGTYERLARVTPLCTRLAALSPGLAAEWQDRLPNPSPVSVLPLLVEPPRRWELPRRPLPYSAIFGFAARLERGKGPDILIHAFSELLRRTDGAYLRLAGVGPLSYALRRRARDLGLAEQCEFAGNYVSPDGRAAFLQSLDIFVLPSLAEGTPNSIIEAMACGLPVIASAVGGIADMITGECGILVPPGDSKALEEAMLKLAGDPELRKCMGSAARERYLQLFAPGAALPVLLRTYGALSGRGAAQTRPTDTSEEESHAWPSLAAATSSR